MLVICTLLLAMGNSIPIISNVDVEGKILKESQENYLVDFSEDIQKLKSTKKLNDGYNPDDFKKRIVNKSVCVKE